MTPTTAPDAVPMTPEQVAAIAVIASATTAAVLALVGILAAGLALALPHIRLAYGTWRATRHLARHEAAHDQADDGTEDQDVRDWFDQTRRAIDALPTTDHPTED